MESKPKNCLKLYFRSFAINANKFAFSAFLKTVEDERILFFFWSFTVLNMFFFMSKRYHFSVFN